MNIMVIENNPVMRKALCRRLEQFSFPLIENIRSKTDRPIIVYSSYHVPEKVEQALKCWADIFIDKITLPKILILKLEALHNMYLRLTK